METKTEIKKANFDERVFFMGRDYPAFTEAVTSAILPARKNDYGDRLKAFLTEKSGGGKAVLFNSAEEAFFWALRYVRLTADSTSVKNRDEIIFLSKNSYDFVVPDIFPPSERLKKAQIDHIGQFIAALSDRTCAVVVDLYSAAGDKKYDKDVLTQMSEICAVRNVAFIIDERNAPPMITGEFFTFTEYGIRPDAVVLGGNVYRAFSIGAVITDKRVKTPNLKKEVGAVACAGTLALIDSACGQKDIVNARAKRLKTVLSICKKVNGFKVFGMKAYADTDDGKKYAAELKDCGVKVGVIENRLLFNIPLNLSEDEFVFGLNALKNVLKGAQNPFDTDKTD